MDINASVEDGVLVARPKNRIDGVNSRDFEEALYQAISENDCSVVLDFGKVVYISSAGLRAILLVTKSLHNKKKSLALCCLSDSIMEVFEISGFNRIIQINTTLDEAKAAVAG